MGRRGIDASVVQHLYIFQKISKCIVSDTNDGCAGWLVQWLSTDIRTVGGGIVGHAWLCCDVLNLADLIGYFVI